ncbi:prephenate dehydratase [Verrucomicrobiaceae bacterium N1E253]|uniref:Bifunctional chorismate mutase/prephenate dehydratase n=1 Tax=Oceaniferula marina TaxID=2748318 RepID=A0A851GA67_9BACT|nr:prephenate dehydratase [Oceaniferula marina]NWK54306.1 prephenate dehydratase [Oceaniferula marina]
MPLDQIRKKIDTLDHQLIGLLSERADLVHEVGEIKKAEGLQIYAPEREHALLRRLAEINQGRIPEKSLRAIYREIMSSALALEDNLTVAYLGPEGTWTHQAAIKKFGHSINYASQANFAEVFDQVARRKAHYGVVPIENSTEGAISHTLDLFVDSPLQICAQIMLRIENGLMACIPRDEIKTLYSHPQVFGQCRNWILRHFPEADLVEVSSTTKAAALARENAPNGAAALGGKLAAELNELTMLEESIQDRSTNTTRFLVIGEETCPATGNDRTSILFSIHDRPGSLVNALQAFDKLNVNMSKIESRPSKQRDWEYIFYVDLAGHCTDAAVSEALLELEKHCSLVKMFGSYPDTES